MPPTHCGQFDPSFVRPNEGHRNENGGLIIMPKEVIHPTFIKEIPKTDLHVHLDGSLRIKTLIDLAKRNKVKLPSYSESGLQELVFKTNYNHLREYLQGFKYTCAVMDNSEALEQISYELAEDCWNEGV